MMAQLTGVGGIIDDSKAVELIDYLMQQDTDDLKTFIIKNEIDNPKAVINIVLSLANNSTLEKLVLKHNQIGDAEVAVFVQFFSKNNTLKYLDLSNNSIGDNGAIAIAKALTKNNTTLETLNLNHNQIGDIGAIELAKNTTLESLFIADNFIEKDGAVALSKNTTLTNISFAGNQIGLSPFLNNTTLLEMDVDICIERMIDLYSCEDEYKMLYIIKRNRLWYQIKKKKPLPFNNSAKQCIDLSPHDLHTIFTMYYSVSVKKRYSLNINVAEYIVYVCKLWRHVFAYKN